MIISGISQLKWLFKASVFLILIVGYQIAYAEYYFVSPATPQVILLEPSHQYHQYKVKKKRVAIKQYRHRTYHHKNSVRMSVYYVNNYPSCCTCQEVWIQGRWDCYSGCGRQVQEVVWYRDDWHRYENRRVNYVYYPRVEITYNPDRTTADDDTWVNPDMDIDE